AVVGLVFKNVATVNLIFAVVERMIHAPQKLVIANVIIDRRKQRSVCRDELPRANTQAIVAGRRTSANLLWRGRGKGGQKFIGNAVGRGAGDVVAQLRRFDLKRSGATSGVARAFVAAEEEGLLFDDRPACVAAEL